MGEAERKRLDHVVLPRRLPGLALLERYFPSPADNQLDAELASFARRRRHRPRSVGRHRLDRAPRDRGRHARGRGRSEPVRADGGQAFLLPPEPRRSMPPLPSWPPRAASTCRCASTSRSCTRPAAPTCRRPVVGEQFIWPRDADAPGRKIYRCANCDVAIGGPVERVAPVDEVDLAKLGIEPSDDAEAADDRSRPATALDPDDAGVPPPVGRDPCTSAGDDRPDADDPLGEAGEPPPPPPPAAMRRPARWSMGRATPPPCCPTRRRVAATDACGRACITSSCATASPCSTGATSWSTSCSTCTPRATCTPCRRSPTRSTPSCATPPRPRSSGWRWPPACCPPAG